MKSLVRILYHDSSEIAGSGIFIPPRYVVTCAHVVTTALGLGEYHYEEPDEPLLIELPLHDHLGEKPLRAQVIGWHPCRKKTKSGVLEDIAVLELDTAINFASGVGELKTNNTNVDLRCRLGGFGWEDGVWVNGTCDLENAKGWTQITLAGVTADPGSSGGPVVNTDHNTLRIIGMTVARVRGKSVAYMIPAQKLRLAVKQATGRAVPMAEPTGSSVVKWEYLLPRTVNRNKHYQQMKWARDQSSANEHSVRCFIFEANPSDRSDYLASKLLIQPDLEQPELPSRTEDYYEPRVYDGIAEADRFFEQLRFNPQVHFVAWFRQIEKNKLDLLIDRLHEGFEQMDQYGKITLMIEIKPFSHRFWHRLPIVNKRHGSRFPQHRKPLEIAQLPPLGKIGYEDLIGWLQSLPSSIKRGYHEAKLSTALADQFGNQRQSLEYSRIAGRIEQLLELHRKHESLI